MKQIQDLQHSGVTNSIANIAIFPNSAKLFK